MLPAMWFALSMTAAVLHALMFVFARMTKGMPSAIVTSIASSWGLFALPFILYTVGFPWHELWWYGYLVFPVLVLPSTLWLLTLSSQNLPVTVNKPLTSFSTLSALSVAIGVFSESFTLYHIAGISAVTIGLLGLYHGRYTHWLTIWPWLGLFASLLLGVNAVALRQVLLYYPHPIALASLNIAMACIFTGIFAGRQWFCSSLPGKSYLLLGIFAIAVFLQDVATFFALTLGPAPLVVAVKRTSVLFALLAAYVFLKERELSLQRLLLSAGVVVIGVFLLNIG